MFKSVACLRFLPERLRESSRALGRVCAPHKMSVRLSTTYGQHSIEHLCTSKLHVASIALCTYMYIYIYIYIDGLHSIVQGDVYRWPALHCARIYIYIYRWPA